MYISFERKERQRAQQGSPSYRVPTQRTLAAQSFTLTEFREKSERLSYTGQQDWSAPALWQYVKEDRYGNTWKRAREQKSQYRPTQK
ncbi:unnamed protein product [Gongylonema pulchrum]|uniref:HMG box domain-containing protein n=1 Tax=Gongylonema pulchrum TaxID=637853 RepID=A0A183CX36_9BILA|nr:unnamed protein product [Gongylonema pulchrum]